MLRARSGVDHVVSNNIKKKTNTNWQRGSVEEVNDPGKRPLRLPSVAKLVAVWSFLYVLFRMVNFYHLLSKNMRPQASALRVPVGESSDNTSMCKALPERLRNFPVAPLVPLTKEQVESQIKVMEPVQLGTTGNRILQCIHDTKSNNCRGVFKVYKNRRVYHQVKRVLQLLHSTGLTSRILYFEDATKTMVEEDMGKSTMLQSPIPLDFDVQLRHIRCELVTHQIVHRDFTSPNFIVDPATGRLYIIDFGDAFVWQGGLLHLENYSMRNLENLFNIWWKLHDEQGQMKRLIDTTQPLVQGKRLWKPPT